MDSLKSSTRTICSSNVVFLWKVKTISSNLHAAPSNNYQEITNRLIINENNCWLKPESLFIECHLWEGVCGEHTHPQSFTWMTVNNTGSPAAPPPPSQPPHHPWGERGSHKHSIWLPLNLFKAAHSNRIINREKISFPRLSPWLAPGCLGRRSGRRWRLSWLPAHTASQRRQVVINTLQITFTGPTWSAWVLLPPGLCFSPPGIQNTLCLTSGRPVWERLTGLDRGETLLAAHR